MRSGDGLPRMVRRLPLDAAGTRPAGGLARGSWAWPRGGGRAGSWALGWKSRTQRGRRETRGRRDITVHDGHCYWVLSGLREGLPPTCGRAQPLFGELATNRPISLSSATGSKGNGITGRGRDSMAKVEGVQLVASRSPRGGWNGEPGPAAASSLASRQPP